MDKILKKMAASPFTYIILVALTYLAGISGHYYQGQALQAIVSKNSQAVFSAALIYAFLHLFYLNLGIVSSYFKALAKIIYFQEDWLKHYPKNVFRRDWGKGGVFFNALFHNAPATYEMGLNLISQLATIATVLIIYLFKIYQDKFYLGLTFLPLLSVMAYWGGGAKQSEVEKSTEKSSYLRQRLMVWCEEFFRAQREIGHNWKNTTVSYNQIGEETALGLEEKNEVGAFKRFLNVLLIDLPYVLCVATILFFAGRNSLTLPDAVVWIGLIEYLVQANNALANCKMLWVERKKMQQMLSSDLAFLHKKNALFTENVVDKVEHSFELPGKGPVILGKKAGLYRVQGKNGSGKSTLLDTVTGRGDEAFDWPKEAISDLIFFSQGKTRTIDPRAIVFSAFDCFWQQIFGVQKGRVEEMGERLFEMFPAPLATSWMELALTLNDKWNERKMPASERLSSGEKVLLSALRAFGSWDKEVKLLVCDEGSSFLDKENKELLEQTLTFLAQKVAIYVVSHQEESPSLSYDSLVTNTFLTGHSKTSEKGVICELRLAALSPGQGKVRGHGNIGSALEGVLPTVLRALIHTHPKYHVLSQLDFDLHCHRPDVSVGECSSSGLAIAFALENIRRLLQGEKARAGIAATGAVMLDGGVDKVAFLEEKKMAALQEPAIHEFYSFQNIVHLKQISEYWPPHPDAYRAKI